MDKAIFIPLIIWAIFVVITVLKKSLSPASRLVTFGVFVVFAFIFKDDVLLLINKKKIPYLELVKETLKYAFISLAILWPAVLIIVQNMTESESSSIIIRLAVFSAAVFAGFLYFH